MQSLLYHYQLGFPKDIELPKGKIKLQYSDHAKTAIRGDYLKKLKVPEELDFSRCLIVEIEVVNGKVIKTVVRMHINQIYDLILVVHPDNGFVRTIWTNRRLDRHQSLDQYKYALP